jgi:hypothetical protein
MTLKKRIKLALAAFLKEELLEFVGYKYNTGIKSIPERVVINQLHFETLQLRRMIHINHDFELNIKRCKEEFLREIEKHIHIDAQTLMEDVIYGAKGVTLSIVVQKKQT